MEPVEVYCSDKGYVCIKTHDNNLDEVVIILSPEQIPLVVKWLKIAMDQSIENGGIIKSNEITSV